MPGTAEADVATWNQATQWVTFREALPVSQVSDPAVEDGLGAVRCLTDARLRERNEAHLADRFGDAAEFGLLVRVPVLGGSAVTPDLTNPAIRLAEWPARPA